ncbi:MAG: hypothetical protein SGCHY_004872 [Lobulomycetales sp.]
MQQEAQQPEQKQQLNTQAQTAASATTPSTSSGSKKKRCEWLVGEEKCMARAAPIVGECRHCSKKFCSKHRLPEAHCCAGMASCHSESMEKFAAKLLSEKTVGARVQKV